MNYDQWGPPESAPANARWPSETGGWLDSFQSLSGGFGFDEVAADVGAEGQARVVIAGLAGAGKSQLFNRFRGWSVTWASHPDEWMNAFPDSPFRLEPFGSFILADLPERYADLHPSSEELLFALGNPALTLYLLDATQGVRPSDYRWVAMLRASGRPLVAALNKCDLTDTARVTPAEAARLLGMPVIPISALTGFNIEERLLPALLDAAPKIAVPMGREILNFRRIAARRIIRQAALFAGLMGGQPMPLVDLPFQAMLQVGVVMRVGAIYGFAPSGGLSREVIGTTASSLGTRYLSLSLMKMVPVLGWAVSGLSSAAMTALIGEGAIRYFELGGNMPLGSLLSDRRMQIRARVGQWRVRLAGWKDRKKEE